MSTPDPKPKPSAAAAEDALAASERRYRSFIRLSSEGIWRFELDEPVDTSLPEDEQIAAMFRHAYLAECNDAMARMYGFDTAGEFTGRRLPQFHDPADAASVEFLRAFIRNGYRLTDAETAEPDRHGRTRVFLNSFVGEVEDGHLVRAWGTQRDITDQRAAETAVRANEQLLRLLTDALPALVSYVDRDLRYRFNNRAYLAWMGIAPDALAGRTVREVLGDGPFKTRVPYMERALRGETVRFEGVTNHITRGVRDTEVSYVPDVRPDGHVEGFVVLAQDVTERRWAERRDRFLLALDDALRPLTDPAEITTTCAKLLCEHLACDRVAYGELDPDGVHATVVGDHGRAGVASMVGRYPLAAFGAEFVAKMHADEPYVVDDVERHHPPIADLAPYRQARIAAVVMIPLHKAGRLAAALAVHQHAPRAWREEEVALVRHVASRAWESIERARITRTLRESEAAFRQLADAMPQMVWSARADGAVDYFNRRWFEYTGLPQDASSGDLNWDSVPDPDVVRRVREVWGDAVRTGQPYEIECPLRRHDGVYRWHLARATPVRDAAGNVIRWFGTNTDIHEHKQLQQRNAELLESERAARAEAERASEAKSEFLATLSHELRTPLTPVLLTVSLLESSALLPPPLRPDVAMIRRNVELESRLISDLLDLTRIAKGKLQLDMQDVDLHLVVRSAVDVCQREASARLTVELTARRHTVRGDGTRLQQVFWNLVNNAIKFTPPDGTITVRSTDAPDGRSIRVEVVDTGAGIDAAVLPRLFTAFEQGEIRSIRQQAGLGLGLAISKKLVDAHDGTIAARSEGRGKGATFTVDLPVVEVFEPTYQPPPPQPTATGATRPLSVLLVEDHESTLNAMVKLLRFMGHRVTAVDSMAGATSAAALDAFDLLICDLGLPDGSGLDVMRTLRRAFAGRAIALTGYGMDADVAASKDAGFTEHLTKPVDLATLEAAIARVAGKL